MKDKTMMMFDHICCASDIDLWAIEELRKVLDAYLADGCKGCAFYNREEWEMPCEKCKRNTKDYWRRAENE